MRLMSSLFSCGGWSSLSEVYDPQCNKRITHPSWEEAARMQENELSTVQEGDESMAQTSEMKSLRPDAVRVVLPSKTNTTSLSTPPSPSDTSPEVFTTLGVLQYIDAHGWESLARTEQSEELGQLEPEEGVSILYFYPDVAHGGLA
jgi:hypothetical protein